MSNFEITVVDEKGNERYLEIQDDVTTKELGQLLHCFTAGITRPIHPLDMWNHITEKGLQRHFLPKIKIDLTSK